MKTQDPSIIIPLTHRLDEIDSTELRRQILESTQASEWLKNAVVASDKRYLVEAITDAESLVILLHKRFNELKLVNNESLYGKRKQ